MSAAATSFTRIGLSTGAAAADPSADSFYHLARIDVRRCGCQGLACFVARHLDPDRWRQAASEQPRVHCLGRCYAAPARGSDATRREVHVDAREGIVLERISRGGVPSMKRLGGYEGLKMALSQPPRAAHRCIVRWTELSSPNSAGSADHWHPVRRW